MTEVDLTIGLNDERALESLRRFTGPNCVPSQESIEALKQTDLVLLSGQFVGAGKSTFIQDLERDGRVNIPSFTNRELRPGEVEGVDKCKLSLGQLAAAAENGELLELEEVRPGVFYATPAKLSSDKHYVKDLELKGALRLRQYAPELPIIVPVPPVRELNDSKGLTEWERRVVSREGFHHSISDKDAKDLRDRLEGVVEEVDRISNEALVDDPNTVIIVNDALPVALSAMKTFLSTREKPEPSDNNVSDPSLGDHLRRVKELAILALVV